MSYNKKRKGILYKYIIILFTIVMVSIVIITVQNTLQNYLGISHLSRVDCSGVPKIDSENEFVWPAPSKYIVSCFKKPEDSHQLQRNLGIYIDTETEAPIYSIAKGEVIAIDNKTGKIIIDHKKKNLLSKYSQLKNICNSIKKGNQVKKGQIIGKMDPKAEELYFVLENKTKGVWVSTDPLTIFKAKKYNLEFDKGLKCDEEKESDSECEEEGDLCDDGIECTNEDICVPDGSGGLKCEGQDYCKSCDHCGDGEINCNEECDTKNDMGCTAAKVCSDDCSECVPDFECETKSVNGVEVHRLHYKGEKYPLGSCRHYNNKNLGEVWKEACKMDPCNLGCRLYGNGCGPK